MHLRKRRPGSARILLLAVAVQLSLGCERIEGMRIGVNYTAKGLCSCLFVMEREIDRCYADMIGAIDRIPIEIDVEAQTVRASIFGLIEGNASHSLGLGCSLE